MKHRITAFATRTLQRVMPLEDFSADLRASAMNALPAYVAFFCFENSARELVSERLTERKGAGWWEEAASKPLKTKVERRQESEGKDRWHMRRGASKIYYTDFGDLASLIRNNWEELEDLFPDVNWVVTRFEELEKSRNIVAHNNVLDSTRSRVSLSTFATGSVRLADQHPSPPVAFRSSSSPVSVVA